jgi:hypothetical protein
MVKKIGKVEKAVVDDKTIVSKCQTVATIFATNEAISFSKLPEHL